MPEELPPIIEESVEIEAAFSRRSWLSLLALTGAGLFVGTQNSEAISGFFSSFGDAHSGVHNMGRKVTTATGNMASFGGLGPNLSAYSAYLQKLKLKNITIQQIIAAHNKKRGSVQNMLPSRALWANIRNTMKVVDSLATRLDHPIDQVVSVYRSPAYNARCAGAKSNSYHLRNNAMDVTFDCSPGKVAAMARAMRSSGLFAGGVGRYPGFTHVDTRGKNADW